MKNEITLATNGIGLVTIDSKALARIEAGMVEQRRISAIFGRTNSQTTAKLMSLQMLSHAPYRALRQCAAEIQKRASALQENSIKLRRSQIEAEKARSEADAMPDGYDRQLKMLDIAALEHSIESSRPYVEGALKDIAALQDAYEQIRTTHGIRGNWDEADFEAGEIENHLKALFKLAYRDLVATGRMGLSACEYAEQFGVHPQVVLKRAEEYINSCQQMIAEGKQPTITHFHSWLQACYEVHKDDPKQACNSLGIVDLITKWSLYVEPEE